MTGGDTEIADNSNEFFNLSFVLLNLVENLLAVAWYSVLSWPSRRLRAYWRRHADA
jgi:hypothetical protein